MAALHSTKRSTMGFSGNSPRGGAVVPIGAGPNVKGGVGGAIIMHASARARENEGDVSYDSQLIMSYLDGRETSPPRADADELQDQYIDE